MRNRADNNQEEIVKGLRAIGASVEILSQVGNGCPDLLVGFRCQTYLIEVKEKQGKLSESQKVWHTFWNGAKVAVVRSFEEAMRVLESGT
jgi:hypothetical protein